MKRLLLWCAGYVWVQLKGGLTERFLNLCRHNGIVLWGVTNERLEDGDCYLCFMKRRDYLQLRPIARKAGVFPLVRRKIGLPFLWRRVLRQKGFLTGLMLFFALLYVFSLHLWDIRITGGYRHTEEQLLSFLREVGVYAGCRMDNVDCGALEAAIRAQYPDIGWVSAEQKGTRLLVRINETVQGESYERQHNTTLTAAHIVAAEDGIITELVMRSGTPLVSIGDVVRAGDILVSGIVEIIGDNAVPLGKKAVLADASVCLKTVEAYRKSFSMTYFRTEYTGNVKKGLEISVLERKIVTYGQENPFETSATVREQFPWKLFHALYLPASHTIVSHLETMQVRTQYTQEEAYERANAELLRYLESLSRSGAVLLREEVTTQIENGVCLTEGTLLLEKKAWDYREIEAEELTMPPVEEETE